MTEAVQNPKISVIIPAYNAEKNLPAVLDSVLSQKTDFPFEVLVTDDGSTDETAKLLADFAGRDGRILPQTIPNSGPAGARNAALLRAKGEIIVFCDSDDLLLPGALQAIAEKMEGRDLLIFAFLLSDEKTSESRKYYHAPAQFQSKKEFAAALSSLYKSNMLNQVWGKGFRRALIAENKLAFPPHKWGEDRLFLFDVLEKAERIAVTDEAFYDYKQTEGSLVSGYVPEKVELSILIDSRVRALAKSLSGVDSLSQEDEKIYNYMLLKSILSCFSTLFSPKCPLSHREKRALIKSALSEEALHIKNTIPDDCGLSFAVLASILRSRNVTLNLFASWGIAFAQKNLSSLFRRAKHAYNK